MRKNIEKYVKNVRYVNERKRIITNFLMSLINYHNFKNFVKKLV